MNVNQAEAIVETLLGDDEAQPVRSWPELRDMSDEEFADYALNLPSTWLNDGREVALDFQNAFVIHLDRESDIVGHRFDTDTDMERWLAYNEEQQGMEVDMERHAYVSKHEPDVPDYTLEQKRVHVVYETGGYIFLKLPHDPDFIRREGLSMQHCLSVAHRDYCERMIGGQIEVYSMTDATTGKPAVDIEVALTKPSYNKPVAHPTVTQIRGPRNQLPPDDKHMPALVEFLSVYGKEKGWVLSGHGVTNFDGRTDGDVVIERWKELHA
jgi:hypothetical protein